RVDRSVGPEAFREEIIEAIEMFEEPVISKQIRVVEEVVIGKNVEQHTETVREKLRHTDVQVEQMMDDPEFHKDYERNYAKAGMPYEKIRPAYAYGQQLAREDRYRGRDFTAIERDARQTFEQRKLGPWDQYKNAVRVGFDRGRAGGAP